MSTISIAKELTSQQCKALLTAQIGGTELNSVDFCPIENVRDVWLKDGTQEQFVASTNNSDYPPTYEIIETDDFVIQAGMAYNPNSGEYYYTYFGNTSYVIDKSSNNIVYSFSPSAIKNESGDVIGTNVYVWSITKWSGNQVLIVYTGYADEQYSLKAVMATVTDSAIVASDTTYTIASGSSKSTYQFHSIFVSELSAGKLFLVWNQISGGSSSYLNWCTGLRVESNGTIRSGTPTQLSTSATTVKSYLYGLYAVNENTAYLFGNFQSNTNPYKAYRVNQSSYSPSLTVIAEGGTPAIAYASYPFMPTPSSYIRYNCSYHLGNYIVFRGYQGHWYKIPSDTTDFTNAERIFNGATTSSAPVHQIVGSKLMVYKHGDTSTTVSCYDAETDEVYYGNSLLRFDMRHYASGTNTSHTFSDLMIYDWNNTALVRVRDRNVAVYEEERQPYFTFVPYTFVDGVLSCVDYNVDTPIVSGESGYTKIVSSLTVTVNTWNTDRTISIRLNGTELFTQQVNESIIIPVSVCVGEDDVLSVCFTRGFGNVKVSAMGGIMEGTL